MERFLRRGGRSETERCVVLYKCVSHRATTGAVLHSLCALHFGKTLSQRRQTDGQTDGQKAGGGQA